MHNVKANIREKLPYEIQTIALDFIDALAEYGVTFYKDNSDCWINKNYYWCKYNLGKMSPASKAAEDISCSEGDTIPHGTEGWLRQPLATLNDGASPLLNDDCVCFISIKDPDEPQNLWTVWSDDMKSEWLENYDADDNIKELAWKHIDHCGLCGSCGGGRRKVVFGREFKAVCGCTFRVDNPNAEDLHFLKEIVKMRINKMEMTTEKSVP